ncbi:hypothetical protein GIW81_08595 [Hyphomicrobium sp. xq]|uniref:Tetratricopeptide repeat-containing protein n=1 Tax=Hyphomicrobium album TaxID=2665159 RepID=A0A6I3KNU6_9HYPH|nr:hypothetical protein [Hyphomicrobium album]MTD94391.1 hypothetical protein [Hyphomicrobium album]
MGGRFRDDWMGITAAGFAAMAEGRLDDAAKQWQQAAREVGREGASDPLGAASYNNAGVAHLLASDAHRAQEKFCEAERLWGKSRAQIESAEIPIAGRSSVFHLRLAMEHHEAFAALRRRKHTLICAAACAITKFNARLAHSVADGTLGNAKADQSLIPTLSAAFGPSCVEIMILRDALADGDSSPTTATFAAYRAKGARLAEPSTHTYVDSDRICADLDCAAQLTALMHPGLLSAPSNAAGATDKGRR